MVGSFETPSEAFQRHLIAAAANIRQGNARNAIVWLKAALGDVNRMAGDPIQAHARSKTMRALNFARRIQYA